MPEAKFKVKSRVRLRTRCFDLIFGARGFARVASPIFWVSSAKNKLKCAKVENGTL
jgi:hypothetical protein